MPLGTYLHTYLTNEIYEILPDKIKSSYESILNKDREELKNKIDTIIESIKTEQEKIKNENSISEYNTSDSTRAIQNANNRNKQKQKKRWYQNVLSELHDENESKKYKFIKKDIEDVKNFMDLSKKVKDYAEGSIPSVDLDKFIKEKVQVVENWSKDKKSLLIDFPYMKEFNTTQINRAFEYDLKTLVYDYILNKYAGNVKSYVFEQIDLLLDYSIFGEKSNLPVIKKYDESSNKNELMYEYANDNMLIRGIINDLTLVNEDAQINFPALDETDLEMISAIFTFRDKDFLLTKTISLKLSDLLKLLNKKKGGSTYEQMKQRINRLSNLTLEIYTISKNKEEKIGVIDKFNFFQQTTLNLHEINTNKDNINFVVSDFIHKQFLDKQTTKIYRKQLDSIKNSISKILLFRLQKDRLSCYLNSLSYTNQYSYNTLAFYIRFKENNKTKNMKLLNECLEELKSLNIIVNDFKKLTDGFLIEFIPFESFEIKDLLKFDVLSKNELELIE